MKIILQHYICAFQPPGSHIMPIFRFILSVNAAPIFNLCLNPRFCAGSLRPSH